MLNRKQSEGWQRIKALQLLHCCLILAKSPDFVLYVEAKLLNKLQSLAKFAKGASDLTRGKVLGKQASTEESGLFLSMLVCAIKVWGTTFQKYELIHRLRAE